MGCKVDEQCSYDCETSFCDQGTCRCTKGFTFVEFGLCCKFGSLFIYAFVGLWGNLGGGGAGGGGSVHTIARRPLATRERVGAPRVHFCQVWTLL